MKTDMLNLVYVGLGGLVDSAIDRYLVFSAVHPIIQTSIFP
jgi:predicted HAD superfamily Cof-like phosphohydrolase